MAEHLKQKEIEDYCGRRLPVKELVFASDHMGECQACRMKVESGLNSHAAFFALQSAVFRETGESASPSTADSHPSFDRIAEYVDGVLAGDELQTVTDHLTGCDQCSLAVEDLQEFRRQVVREHEAGTYSKVSAPRAENRWFTALGLLPSLLRRSPVLAFGSALIALLLIVTGWLIWPTLREKGTEGGTAAATSPSAVVPSPEAEGRAISVVAQLNDGNGRVTLDREGRISGIDNLKPSYRSMVTDALTDQHLKKPALLTGLSRDGGSLMGREEQGGAYSVKEPVGKVVLSDRPTFQWSPMDRATGYIVEIYDEKFNPVTASPKLAGNSWTATQPFKRGEVYSWQVKAIKDGQQFKAPRPPAPQARFCVLDQGSAEELAQAQRAYGSSHLVLGLLYARAGLLDEAERELSALQKENSGSAVVRRLMESVQAMRR